MDPLPLLTVTLCCFRNASLLMFKGLKSERFLSFPHLPKIFIWNSFFRLLFVLLKREKKKTLLINPVLGLLISQSDYIFLVSTHFKRVRRAFKAILV